jgi:hypothetical protein
MAHFIGQAGDYQKERALNRRLNAVMAIFVIFSIVLFALGWISGFCWGKRPQWSHALVLIALVSAVPVFKYLDKRFDRQLRLARKDEDGAEGERSIIPYLRALPDTYTVISDLDFADSYGNIDHLVIGPTGVFAIDVKNWRGTVAADGKGELLCNGRPTDKPQVRAFTARTMDLKERLRALARLDPYVQCLFVFPHTRVEAKWGTTGPAICLRIEQTADYITKNRPKSPIATADLARLVSAAKALKEAVVTHKSVNRGQVNRGGQ